jgi:hypothetical protein
MTFWLDHPSYRPVRDRLIDYLTSSKYRFRRLSPVIFLCGGLNSPARNTLRDYLAKRVSGLALFYAEDVWQQIATRSDLSALEMEEYLAQLADMLIILVESPGTFTELGAFSVVASLRDKLLPILDIRYRNDKSSFIATGPVQWIDNDSRFKPAIYADLERVLTAIAQVEDRLERLPKPSTTRVENLAISPKHLLFFICDLLAVIEPATREIIEYYITQIVPGINTKQVSTLIGLGVAMALIAQSEFSIRGTTAVFYYRPSIDSLVKPFHHDRWLDLPTHRAEQAGALLAIAQGRDALEELKVHL